MTTTRQSLALVVLVVGLLSLFALISSNIVHEQRRTASFDFDIKNSNIANTQSSIRVRELSINPVFADPKSVILRSDLPLEDNNHLELLKSLKQSEEIWTRVPLPKISDNTSAREALAKKVADAAAKVEELELGNILVDNPLTICGREYLQHRTAACPAEFTQSKPIVLLSGSGGYGRTGNQLAELLHAFIYAYDKGSQLGIMSDSWATKLITPMFMAYESQGDILGGKWQDHIEKILCAKMFNAQEELEGWDVINVSPGTLFGYKSTSPMGEYMVNQLDFLRRFWTNYNTGDGFDLQGRQVGDMCSGIDAIFGMDQRKDVIYSAIHSRSMEGHPGIHHLKVMSQRTGCDRLAALDMHPEYIKAILEPLGMLQHPIVVITDGQNPDSLNRLLADPDIGSLIRLVPKEASWIGGDVTLAVNSNVFIGNPVSSFGNFIAKSRLALGMGHNELFKNHLDEDGKWRTVCGDHCLFDMNITP